MARRTALRLLSLRSYHSGVLKRKLQDKGYSLEVCEKVLQECHRMGLLQDDDAILREYRRGYGPRWIAYKLHLELSEIQKLITRSMQREKILQLRSKFDSREKAFRGLQRRGFDFDLLIEIFSCSKVEE